jgi:uncharacterized protein (TIGR02996 family)
MAPRNPKLEAVIAKDPDDPGPYLVYADWLSGAGKYRLQEFMLASQGYLSANVVPDPGNHGGVLPTADATINGFIPEGGNSDRTCWTRLDARALESGELEAQYAANPAMRPVLDGGDFAPVVAGGTTSAHLSGLIDLTRFYALARANGFFPGQRGFWVDRWVGFEVTDHDFDPTNCNPTCPANVRPAGSYDPNEPHTVEWAGVIFEAHGPWNVNVHVHRLNVFSADAVTGTAYP